MKKFIKITNNKIDKNAVTYINVNAIQMIERKLNGDFCLTVNDKVYNISQYSFEIIRDIIDKKMLINTDK